MSDQENRKTGIITAGFIIPGIQKFHSSNAGSGSNRFETQTVAWWETTTFASTTEKPKIAFKPSNNRGLETTADAPTFESFNQVMAMATLNSALDPWEDTSDEAKAAFCTGRFQILFREKVQNSIFDIWHNILTRIKMRPTHSGRFA